MVSVNLGYEYNPTEKGWMLTGQVCYLSGDLDLFSTFPITININPKTIIK
jgi:hypothetical protein